MVGVQRARWGCVWTYSQLHENPGTPRGEERKLRAGACRDPTAALGDARSRRVSRRREQRVGDGGGPIM